MASPRTIRDRRRCRQATERRWFQSNRRHAKAPTALAEDGAERRAKRFDVGSLECPEFFSQHKRLFKW